MADWRKQGGLRTVRDAGRTVALATVAALAIGVTGPVAPSRAQDGGVVAVPQGPVSVADLAEGLLDAVVNISTTQRVSGSRNRPGPRRPQREGSPFEEFFDEFFDDNNSGPRGRRVQSLGSGFVVDAEEGIVITNNHVIAEADEVQVNFADGTDLDATVIGRDPKTDLAVLKVEPGEYELTEVSFGDSEVVRVGDWVLAIGNPFGFGGTVTLGIVSAQDRDINSGPYDKFIQTDAAINRGNSGGPLFNMDGDVIGVNTAIYSPTGGSVGVGFAVPSNIATNVVEQLREFGEIRRGWIGVRIREVSEELAEGLELEAPKGALVEDVTKDGPAAEGGIEIGDVILSFDGKDIEEMRDLPKAVAETPAGDTVRVIVSRKGKTQTLKLKVGLMDAEGNTATEEAPEVEAGEDSEEILGMTLTGLDRKQREAFELKPEQEGVLVTEVESTSAAAKKGLRRGDVIVEVAQESVATPEEVIAKVRAQKAEGKGSVLLLVSRRGDVRFVALRFEDAADE